MTSPLFATNVSNYPATWETAFPEARVLVGLPKDFLAFQCSVILLDFSALSHVEKKSWLSKALECGRDVVVLSPTPNDDEALWVIRQGAKGYGHAHSAPSRLQEMQIVVEHGGLWVGNQLLKRILSGLDKANKPIMADAEAQQQQMLQGLSAREAMVAKQVAMGATNQEISKSLEITERTVKAHVSSVFEKLGVRNRVELALKLSPLSHSGAVASKAG